MSATADETAKAPHLPNFPGVGAPSVWFTILAVGAEVLSPSPSRACHRIQHHHNPAAITATSRNMLLVVYMSHSRRRLRRDLGGRIGFSLPGNHERAPKLVRARGGQAWVAKREPGRAA